MSILSKLDSIFNGPQVRDFSVDAEKRLKDISKQVNDNEDIIDKGLDYVGRWLDGKGWLRPLLKAESYQKIVIDAYNYDVKVIERIYENARNYDRSYGSKLAYEKSISESGVELISNLVECLNPASTKYDMREGIDERLLWFDNRFGELFNEIETDKFSIDDHIITNEEILCFCNNDNPEMAFDKYYDYIYLEELQYGVLQTTGVVIFQGIKITKEEVANILTNENYQEKFARENLNELVESYINSDNTCQNFMKDHDAAKELIISALEEYEKNEKISVEEWKKLFPEYELSTWKKFANFVGGTTVLKEMAKKYPEYLDYLINDYAKGVELLNSLTEYSNNMSPEMKKAIEKLKNDYDDKFEGMVGKLWKEGVSFAEDQGINALSKWVKKKIPVYGVLKTCLEITGGEKTTEAYCKLLSMQTVYSDTKAAYVAAIRKVQSGQYTSKDLENVKSLFNLMKEAQISIFKAYRDMNVTDPMKQVFANEQIDKLQNMTINNYRVNQIDTYCY